MSEIPVTTIKRLQQDLKSIQNEPIEGVYVELYDDSNFFDWRIFFEGPKDTPFENGIYEAKLKFPTEYPYAPPELVIISKFYHPNVYTDGKVCLSVLHSPGTDPLNPGETPEMRWLPIHTVSSILQCFLSILDHPGGAPANVSAQSEYNNNREGYILHVKQYAADSLKYILPHNVKIPHPDTDPNDPSYQKRIRNLREEFKSPSTPLFDDDDNFDDDNFDDNFDYVDYDEEIVYEIEEDVLNK